MENYGIYYIKSLLPSYFHSEWSFSQQYLTEPATTVAFSDDNKTVSVVGHSGNFYSMSILEDGKMIVDKTIQFVSDENDPFSDRTNTIR
jgi:hypothetical protein